MNKAEERLTSEKRPPAKVPGDPFGTRGVIALELVKAITLSMRVCMPAAHVVKAQWKKVEKPKGQRAPAKLKVPISRTADLPNSDVELAGPVSKPELYLLLHVPYSIIH